MLIRPYSATWASDFQRIETVLAKALTGTSFTIEHIGSTAVPGLAAKPIIDLDIAFDNNTDFNNIKSKLELLGYYHNGNQGITDREVFKRSAESISNNILDMIAHHLYVCPADSEELKRHLLFRNYLRSNAAARNTYEQLKYQLAEEAKHNKKLYAQLKEEKAKAFIESIVAKAVH
ncbi:GrpB family protein [Lacibacter luteus]|uniref:GrpB family protein n=1 Tax=Lacibacter luteus TaxID=2508719 RepID=A0A4V1M867_9BACT|nr:GrpB family protein [Lacibacter luteus]RXK62792.1 GrpB family protein [Lacibacter luteus]